ncbi:restriction endonuclease [Vulcanisaeta sp. JCM 16159]|uniref:restriction endonuclease n=1 Tax=Vulcanisaeta sp. JCM 16159 TaxID=1295371 RepID=UPI000AEE6465|nr:restriction endonuclease [Vulcanisaeta sp. JCM 16159]
MSLRERLVKALIIVSRDGVFTHESLKSVSGLGDSMIDEFIGSLINDGVLVRVGDGYKSVMPPHKLIKYFVDRGVYVDLESVSRYLPWDEFEALIRLVFEEWGFRVVSRLRVPVAGSRVEFDVIAYRRPWVLLIEAKRWRRVSSSIRQIVDSTWRRLG